MRKYNFKPACVCNLLRRWNRVLLSLADSGRSTVTVSVCEHAKGENIFRQLFSAVLGAVISSEAYVTISCLRFPFNTLRLLTVGTSVLVLFLYIFFLFCRRRACISSFLSFLVFLSFLLPYIPYFAFISFSFSWRSFLFCPM